MASWETYTQVPDWVMAHRQVGGLSLAAVLLYGRMRRYRVDRDGRARVAAATMMTYLGVGRTQYKAVLSELKRAKLITVERTGRANLVSFPFHVWMGCTYAHGKGVCVGQYSDHLMGGIPAIHYRDKSLVADSSGEAAEEVV